MELATSTRPRPDEKALAGDPAAAGDHGRRRPWAAAVAALTALALVLRLWGLGHGLPYAYNADENAHFVPGAIALFGHSWNPHYFVNPPAYTYLLHVVFGVWFGGRDGVAGAYPAGPPAVPRVPRGPAGGAGGPAGPPPSPAGARVAGP